MPQIPVTDSSFGLGRTTAAPFPDETRGVVAASAAVRPLDALVDDSGAGAVA